MAARNLLEPGGPWIVLRGQNRGTGEKDHFFFQSASPGRNRKSTDWTMVVKKRNKGLGNIDRKTRPTKIRLLVRMKEGQPKVPETFFL